VPDPTYHPGTPPGPSAREREIADRVFLIPIAERIASDDSDDDVHATFLRYFWAAVRRVHDRATPEPIRPGQIEIIVNAGFRVKDSTISMWRFAAYLLGIMPHPNDRITVDLTAADIVNLCSRLEQLSFDFACQRMRDADD
jgi:hypothetical protein